MSHEHEQSIEQQKLAQVKEEMAKLREAIKKHEGQPKPQEKQPDADDHQPKELFVTEHKVVKHDIIVARHKNSDTEGTKEQHHQLLDVSPGDHTVVEL
jgi:hypothetical protein